MNTLFFELLDLGIFREIPIDRMSFAPNWRIQKEKKRKMEILIREDARNQKEEERKDRE